MLKTLNTIIPHGDLQHCVQDSLYICLHLSCHSLCVFCLFLCRSFSVSHQFFFNKTCSMNLVYRFDVSMAKLSSGSSWKKFFWYFPFILFSLYLIQLLDWAISRGEIIQIATQFIISNVYLNLFKASFFLKQIALGLLLYFLTLKLN